MKRTSYPVQLTSVRARQALNNAFVGSGALDVGDRGAWQNVPTYTGNPYDSNDYVYRWRQYVHLYELSWEARKIVRIPVEDALRKQWLAEDIPEEMSKAIHSKLNQLNFTQVLGRSLMLERLLGGCLTFMGLDAAKDDTGVPFKPSEGATLRFLNAIPVSRISRMTWDTNPLSEHYMRPSKYLINGEDVHVSRCLVWDGEPLFDPYDFALTNFRSNIAGFGPSKLAPIWDDVVKAVGTRQAAYQMIQTNNSIIMAIKDLQNLEGTNAGAQAMEKLKTIANTLSLYRAALIDGDKVNISQSAASFGSVPELIITFIQVLSAASDIPATRFLGQAPGGLNATGESDLENYYNMIDAYQRQRIEPQLRRVYDVIGYAKFRERWHKEREKLTFKFPPLWNLSELEEADRASKVIDNAMKMRDAGLMSDEKFLEEVNAKEVFSVELDETDISVVEDTGLEGGMGFGGEQPNPQEEIEKLRGREQGQVPKQFENLHLDRLPTPTDAQKHAGNYKKHHVKLHGLDIAVENPKGSERSGVDPEGKAWSSILPAHYGYVKRTEGADGDHVDVYIGPHEASDQVFVVDQQTLDGKFDEHKCIFGALSLTQAKELYLSGFSDGKAHQRLGAITPVTVDAFKQWLREGDTKQPFANSTSTGIFEAVWNPGQEEEFRLTISAEDDQEAFRVAATVGRKRGLGGAPETLTRMD